MPFSQSGGGTALTSSPGFEIGYTQITASANITDTAEATGTALITSSALVFDGAPVMFEFFSPAVLCDTNAAGDIASLTLWEVGGVGEIGIFAQVRSVITSSVNSVPVRASYRFTPSAGTHTYKVAGFVTSTVGTPRIGAGAGGGAGNIMPAFIRFTKV